LIEIIERGPLSRIMQGCGEARGQGGMGAWERERHPVKKKWHYN